MKKRTPRLLRKLEKRLLSYAAAATAAGVSSLALAPSAGAKIIYTPAHTKIRAPRRFGLVQIPLSLNHDGAEFVVQNFFGGSAPNSYAFLNLAPTGSGNQALARNGLALALPAGTPVKFDDHATYSFVMAGWRTEAGNSTTFAGPWANSGKGVKDRYLGLRFVIRGQVHYGWARLNVSFKNGAFSGLLNGYAYETVPNKSIVTGKTEEGNEITPTDDAGLGNPVPKSASLGALAQGALGLQGWRSSE